jgi:hypothetical protein
VLTSEAGRQNWWLIEAGAGWIWQRENRAFFSAGTGAAKQRSTFVKE